jgi:hypothetical protein
MRLLPPEEQNMRAVLIAMLVVLSVPALAQTGGRSRGGDITKEEYVERAKRAAERRFDRLDLNHDGVLSADERRAARGAATASGRAHAVTKGAPSATIAERYTEKGALRCPMMQHPSPIPVPR